MVMGLMSARLAASSKQPRSTWGRSRSFSRETLLVIGRGLLSQNLWRFSVALIKYEELYRATKCPTTRIHPQSSRTGRRRDSSLLGIPRDRGRKPPETTENRQRSRPGGRNGGGNPKIATFLHNISPPLPLQRWLIGRVPGTCPSPPRWPWMTAAIQRSRTQLRC